jgi:dTDP-4-amino-4,6-dideoxygalactose transaminase
MSDAIPLAEPVLSGNAQAYLDECVRTNFVSSVGPFVERFEREFAAAVGVRHAIACASGTAAIHVAMRLVGVDVGDEVFVPTLTFIASANPVLYERGTPVLVDSEEVTYNISPELVVEELGRRASHGLKQPKAVEVVHLLGRAADMEPIVDACERYGIPLIEDAAEALGATYETGRFAGRQVGSIGLLGCFSFNGNKVITTGGGGMITTNDSALAKRAKHLTTQARLPKLTYEHDEVGYNYRLTNLAAALGVAQLECLRSFLQRKADIAHRYDTAFHDLTPVRIPTRPSWQRSSDWMYTIRVSDRGARDALIARLREHHIESRPIWTPLHAFPMYSASPRLGGNVSDLLFDTSVSLPCSVSLTIAQQDRVIKCVLNAVGT